MSKIINGVASEYDFPFKDFDVRYDEENIQKFNRWQDPTIEEYKKEIERLNNNINATRNCILKDISILKNRKISNEEMITRLEATLKIIENELKGDNK